MVFYYWSLYNFILDSTTTCFVFHSLHHNKLQGVGGPPYAYQEHTSRCAVDSLLSPSKKSYISYGYNMIVQNILIDTFNIGLATPK